MLIIFVLAALLFLCFFILRTAYDRFWDRGFTCSVDFQEEYAAEGETSVLSEVIINDKVLPMPVVEIDFHMDRRLQFVDGANASVSDQSYRRDVFSLSMRQKITRRLEFDCVRRGYMRIDEAGVTAQDLFLTRKYLLTSGQSTDFFVLPRPVDPSQINIPFSRIMGEVLSRKKVYDDPFEFAGLREYTLGDPMKYINWKATARTGQLLTNIHESTLSQNVILLLDAETNGIPQGEQLCEAAIRVACSLCDRLLREGVTLSLSSNGLDAQSGQNWSMEGVSGSGSLTALRKKFACLDTGSGLPPVCSSLLENSRMDEEPLLVLVSRIDRQDLVDAFSQLVGKGRGIQVIPYFQRHQELVAPSNLDLVWMEF